MDQLLMIEDDQLFAIEVKMLIKEFFSEVDIIHFASAKEAEQYPTFSDVDLLLLDVVLEDEKAGIRLAKKAKEKNIPVIFMTAFQRADLFKLAIQTEPYNYLQKPFSGLELKQAIDLALYHATKEKKKEEEQSLQDQYVLFKGSGKVRKKVKVKDIIFIESFGNYCSFHTAKHKYIHRMALKDFAQFIESEYFVRIHRNFVINIRYLESVDTKGSVVLLAGKPYPLSRKYKKDLLGKFSQLK